MRQNPETSIKCKQGTVLAQQSRNQERATNDRRREPAFSHLMRSRPNVYKVGYDPIWVRLGKIASQIFIGTIAPILLGLPRPTISKICRC